ncbi:Multiple inositol polyphosphate phosphatase 1-like protein [Leptotrombidium deliense]|uniref:Multiple inositol polyphosphate phosphatase 1 n=1 Tax=Leptotrombidium deliense TaxID=299467 RepID=A0A443SG69_9ACAR|nr:Multiple inositol polyphosphate phosphatase 1-like protein [Leptotrombidium deliense]
MINYLPSFRDEILKKKGELCDEDLMAFERWKINMKPDDDNNVAERGREETILTALNYRKLFKKNFDPEKADIHFGVTSKIRTSQTADAFITGLRISKALKNSICEDDSSESSEEKLFKKSSINSWHPPKEELDFLNFHGNCKQIYKSKGGKLEKPKAVKDFRKSTLISDVAKVVKQRLGIRNNTDLSDFDFVDMIIRACKFEYAIDGDSPWCAAFGEPEIQIMEYYEDLEDILDDGHGRQMNLEMPCPLFNDLKSKIQRPEASRRLKTYAYFTHAGALKRLWASLGLFKDEQLMSNYSSPETGYCLNNRKQRNWRSSLNTPFGANVCFAVYGSKYSKKRPTIDYRVMTLVNGKPERIRNCGQEFCKLDEFLQQFSDTRNCDMQSICSPKILRM